MAGYSGTPLAKKLGIRAGSTLALLGAPEGFRRELGDDPELMGGVSVHTTARSTSDVIVAFVTERERFEAGIAAWERSVFPNGGLWIAWPKKASKVPTDMTEDVVREVGLPRGLVDNKVCAIDDTWSGLRLVWRKELRSSPLPPEL
jgi:hypothetical protein